MGNFMKELGLIGLAALSACATAAASLQDIDGAYDWSLDDGRALASGFSRDMKRLLGGADIGEALRMLSDTGYSCATGKAREDQPGAVSVCEKSSATRACQLDWAVRLQPKDARVHEIETDFTRDCVGVDRDWPSATRSAIDAGLAPPRNCLQDLRAISLHRRQVLIFRDRARVSKNRRFRFSPGALERVPDVSSEGRAPDSIVYRASLRKTAFHFYEGALGPRA
jgi:hypothetical protein